MPHLLNVDPRGFTCEFHGYFYLQAFSINDVVFIFQIYFLYGKNVQAELSFFQRFEFHFHIYKTFKLKWCT